ncbi:SMP-30/gluconolactonase/LRE family protein, partial [Nonomuraea sp. RK-328]|nr:SMP-30/gluconolactonase/LRE family protein [Nonomuraea sp. RK-328]
MDWSVAADSRCVVAERPVWDARTASLYWVDCLRGEVHRRRDPAPGEVVWRSGSTAGAAVLREDGGLAVAAGGSVVFLDEEGTQDRPPIEVDQMSEGSRFNDAVCDPAGRLLAGTTSGTTPGSGMLFSIDSDRTVRRLLDGLSESNGLGWSPDGSVFYHVDSGGAGLRAFDYEMESGTLHGERLLMSFADAEGIPDGLSVDRDGDLWIAVWAGGQILRVSPDGRVRQRIDVPVSHPTCVTFGGTGLRELFLTSATYGLSDRAQREQLAPGGVLVARPGVAGMAPARLAASR